MAEIRVSTQRDYVNITNAIVNFNMRNLPANASGNMTNLGYVITEPKVGVVGGVYGKLILGNNLSVDVLWVDEEHRNKDYGSQLMLAIENAAMQLGSNLSIVDTFDFQALDFYKKLGYAVFGVLEDCPTLGHKRYYLSKKLHRL